MKRKKLDNKEKFVEVIKNHGDNVWKPKYNVKLENIKTNSCFDISKYKINKKDNITLKPNFKFQFPDKMVKCIKVDMKLNKEQKIIMLKWMNAYLITYNTTLKYIKNGYKNDKNFKLNFYNIRQKLYDDKIKIIDGSQIKSFKHDTTVKTHILDGAIKLAVSNYKSALTNYRKGDIKRFKIKLWKFNKTIKILDVEKTYFSNKTMCKSVFGNKIECFLDNKEFNLNNIKQVYKCDCKIQYNKLTDKFILLVPEIIKTKQNNNKINLISLDPGIRTFMTGLSDNEVLKIGSNISKKIRKKNKKIEKINKHEHIKKSDKKKIEKRENIKITNLVDELHWKSINYLTTNYKSILIGDMSVKGIVSKKTSKLHSTTKQIAIRLKFFQFRKRLEYKCIINKIPLRIIDESYTSKICSNCGSIKDDLGANKKYKCNECKIKLDRDVNGCRGIILKSMLK